MVSSGVHGSISREREHQKPITAQNCYFCGVIWQSSERGYCKVKLSAAKRANVWGYVSRKLGIVTSDSDTRPPANPPGYLTLNRHESLKPSSSNKHG